MTPVSDQCPRCASMFEEGDRFCQDCGLNLLHPLHSPLLNQQTAGKKQDWMPSTGPADCTQTSPFHTIIGMLTSVSIPEWILVLAMAIYSGATVYFVQKSHPQWLQYGLRKVWNMPATKPHQRLPGVQLPGKTDAGAVISPEVDSLFQQSEQRADRFPGLPAGSSTQARSQIPATPRTRRHQLRAARVTQSRSVVSPPASGSHETAVSLPASSNRTTATSAMTSELPATSTTNAVQPESAVTQTPPVVVSRRKHRPLAQSKEDIDNLAQYNKQLVRYFSRRAQQQNSTGAEAVQESDAGAAGSNGSSLYGAKPDLVAEPPSFQEWMNSNKPEF